MGERKIDRTIVTAQELIEAKFFDKLKDVYDIPESVLPRVRINGKKLRPLRFYQSDVNKVFSRPLPDEPEQRPVIIVEQPLVKMPRASIQFKKRRK